MNRNKGFTLIELIAVVAILSILLVVAIANYQDYLIRGKVSEGLASAGEARTSVSDYYYNIQDWPADNEAAGLLPADNYSQFEFIERLTLSSIPRPGTISVVFDIPGTGADGKELRLIPSTLTDTIDWTCFSPEDNALQINHVPASCRDG